MKSFECRNCGAVVEHPAMPMKCDACNTRRIGLFKPHTKSAAPSAPQPEPVQPPVAKETTVSSPPAPKPPPPIPAQPVSPPPPKKAPVPPVKKPDPVQPVVKQPDPVQPAAKQPEPPPETNTPPVTVNPDLLPPEIDTPPATRDYEPDPVEAIPVEQKPSPPAKEMKPPVAEATPVRPEPAQEKQPSAETPAKPPQAEKPAPPQEPPPKPAPKPAAKAPQPGDELGRYPVHLPGQGGIPLAIRGGLASCGKEGVYACIGANLELLQVSEKGITSAWKYETKGNIPGSPVVGRDGHVRVHSGDGQLHCVNSSGRQQWRADVGEPLGWSAPLVDEAGDTYISSYNGGILKIGADGSRTTHPFFRSRQKFDSTGLLHKDRLFIGAEDAFVYALRTGEAKGNNTWNPLDDRGKTEWFINSAPALGPEETIIVAGRDEYLYCFKQDGTIAWRLHIRGQMLASPIVAEDGGILVGVSLIARNKKSEGKLICVQPGGKNVAWEFSANSAVESTPVLGDDGVVYFGDNEGFLHAVDRRGKKVFSKPVGPAIRSAGHIPLPNVVMFGNDEGQVVALHCSSKSVAPGGWPKYMGP